MSIAVISPSEKVLPARLNMDLIKHLQENVAPDIFTPQVVYDGRKNAFSPRQLAFRDGAISQEVRGLFRIIFTMILLHCETVSCRPHGPCSGRRQRPEEQGSQGIQD
jgi:hypothetical protein